MLFVFIKMRRTQNCAYYNMLFWKHVTNQICFPDNDAGIRVLVGLKRVQVRADFIPGRSRLPWHAQQSLYNQLIFHFFESKVHLSKELQWFFERDACVTLDFCHTSNEILIFSISRFQNHKKNTGLLSFFENSIGVTLDFCHTSNEILRFSISRYQHHQTT